MAVGSTRRFSWRRSTCERRAAPIVFHRLRSVSRLARVRPLGMPQKRLSTPEVERVRGETPIEGDGRRWARRDVSQVDRRHENRLVEPTAISGSGSATLGSGSATWGQTPRRGVRPYLAGGRPCLAGVRPCLAMPSRAPDGIRCACHLAASRACDDLRMTAVRRPSRPRSPWASDDHELFRETARAWVEREILPNDERWQERGYVDAELWRSAGEAGLLGTDVPAEHGGLGRRLRLRVRDLRGAAARGLRLLRQGRARDRDALRARVRER